MDSLRMIGELEASGTLTKQAGHRLRLQRAGLVRDALVKEAGGLGQVIRDAKDVFARSRAVSPSLTSIPRHVIGEGARPGWGAAGGNILKLMALAGMASAASAGINAGIRHSRDKKLNSEIEHSYTQLMTENPALAKRDPELVRKHFEVLARYAPSLAANPTVAAGIVGETAHNANGLPPQSIKMMTDIQRSIDAQHSTNSPWSTSPLHEHLGLAGTALGGK